MNAKTGKAQRCVQRYAVILQTEVEKPAGGGNLQDAALLDQVNFHGRTIDVSGGKNWSSNPSPSPCQTARSGLNRRSRYSSYPIAAITGGNCSTGGRNTPRARAMARRRTSEATSTRGTPAPAAAAATVLVSPRALRPVSTSRRHNGCPCISRGGGPTPEPQLNVAEHLLRCAAHQTTSAARLPKGARR